MRDTLENKLGFVLIGVIIGMLTVAVTYIGDRSDPVNTAAFGQLLCNEYGMDYDYRTINESRVPIIHCKDKEVAVINGIVLGERRVKQ